MKDWNKLTVAHLRTELKTRGLSQQGLKAALVARLEEAERVADAPLTEESEAEKTEQQNGSTHGTDVTNRPSVEPSKITHPAEPSSANANSNDNGAVERGNAEPQVGTSTEDLGTGGIEREGVKLARGGERDGSETEDCKPESRAEHEDVEREDVEPDNVKPKDIEPESIPTTDGSAQGPTLPDAPADATIGDVAKAAAKEEKEESGTTPTAANDGHSSSTPPVATEIPAHSTQDGTDPVTAMNGTPPTAPVEPQPVTDTEVSLSAEREAMEVREDLHKRKRSSTSPTPPEESSPKRVRHDDAEQTEDSTHVPDSAMAIDAADEAELRELGRSVAPAIYPATTALYIRNFMRPLREPLVREHLVDLAAQPGSEPDPDVLVEFYLDHIRTHAFARFQSVVAAARVRSALHDQVWPNERDRRVLWVDFIPPEKVSEWVAKERASSGGRPSAAVRWQVVYGQDDDGNVTATLEEGSVAPAAPSSARPGAGREMGPPTGPRPDRDRRDGPRIVGDASRGRLDGSLVTVASPQLYYRPVSEALSKRRLENMRSYEPRSPRYINPNLINRYTFEDDYNFVDRGRENFVGIRPPHRERERQSSRPDDGGGGSGGGGRGPPGSRGGVGRPVPRGGDRYVGGGSRRDGAGSPRYWRDDDHMYRPDADRRQQGYGDEGRLSYNSPTPRSERGGWDDPRDYRDRRY